MPTEQLKHLAERAGKTLKEAEDCWNKSKQKVDEKLKETDEEYWPRVMILTKMCLGIKTEKKRGRK